MHELGFINKYSDTTNKASLLFNLKNENGA